MESAAALGSTAILYCLLAMWSLSTAGHQFSFDFVPSFVLALSPGVRPDAGCSMDGSETSPATGVGAEELQDGPVEGARGLVGNANALCACRRNTVGSLAVVYSCSIIPGAHRPRRSGSGIAMDLPSCGKGSASHTGIWCDLRGHYPERMLRRSAANYRDHRRSHLEGGERGVTSPGREDATRDRAGLGF